MKAEPVPLHEYGYNETNNQTLLVPVHYQAPSYNQYIQVHNAYDQPQVCNFEKL